MEIDWCWNDSINKMDVICDTSFLMVLCYEPIKNMDFLESKFGKTTFLIHTTIIRELTQIKHTGKIKRSKIANLALEIIKKETENKNFQYIKDNDSQNLPRQVDSQLLALSLQKKCPLATIDKNLIKMALKKGSDVITLKNNKIIYVHSNNNRSEQI
jgi:rRNA-processing protein FCF1